jgi:hypothetical protein
MEVGLRSKLNTFLSFSQKGFEGWELAIADLHFWKPY